ncbi:DBF4-like A [Solea senegalensis]|uniref:DBF4-like A n=2 Tax=Solea senegalensis TaxID=28829 RepID=A0AAV6PQL3_SOLSE|nr:protein DBF4 homolog A [Solea senegalensis]KAG7474598.1 DBF4-like A [Solea senegalensis]
MKPKRIQRPRGPNWQGKPGDTITLSQTKPTSHVSSSTHSKPFAGRVFYLDLPSNRTTEILESDIKQLGGTVEKFFSKEIKYLVSNKREAQYVQCLRQDSPVPSPDSGPSSPHPCSNPHRPGSHGDNIKNRSQGQIETFVTSRGKSLVEKVVKVQERAQLSKILSNALEWGVKILYIKDVMAYVQKRKRVLSSQCPATSAVKTNVKAESTAKQGFQKCKAGRITKPFVKVEDSSRHYRPIYRTMPNMPEFKLKSLPPCSPFCVEDKYSPGNKPDGKRGAKASASEEKVHGRKKNRDKKRGGYCECCVVKYEKLTTHLQSERHKAFSKSDDKYLVVDRQISSLHCNFIHINAKAKRPKCSVSSVVVATGPCGKTELSHRADLNATQTIKQEQNHQTLSVESNPGYAVKIRSLPVSVPLMHKDRRSTYLARKWQFRKKSWTACSQNAQDVQSPRLTKETASSIGECHVSLLSLATQVDSVDQILHKDTNGSPSPPHINDFSNRINVTKQQEEHNMNKDLLPFEALENGNASPDNKIVTDLPENTQVLSQNFSPVRKIQRRIRVYKRKRRKVDPHIEHAKPSKVPDNSSQKLWELFQSSDDMDVEFHGFEDEDEE